MSKRLFLLLVILLVGCANLPNLKNLPGSTPRESTTAYGIKADIVKGSNGLRSQYYLGDAINLKVEARNLGGYAGRNNQLEIIGEVVGALANENVFDFSEGKKIVKESFEKAEHGEETEVVLDFGDIRQYRNQRTELRNLDVKVELCSEYATRTSLDVSYKRAEGTNVNIVEQTNGPVGINIRESYFNEDDSGQEGIVLIFDIVNREYIKGRNNLMPACGSEADNNVMLRISSDLEINCKEFKGNAGKVILDKNKVMECFVPAPSEANFETRVEMITEYSFKRILSERIDMLERPN